MLSLKQHENVPCRQSASPNIGDATDQNRECSCELERSRKGTPRSRVSEQCVLVGDRSGRGKSPGLHGLSDIPQPFTSGQVNLGPEITTRRPSPADFRARGGTGIRVRFRTVWSNPWRFKSSRAHTQRKPTLHQFFVWPIIKTTVSLQF